ncbi:GNAT family N-acetyltransferase [Aliihoeflea sp. 40Bstr573]|uniref:GNAT family N-acetyltransferase n=1 Tax=Aliihoeflea sp. 40Bstr573 TaxID=2696467 RepID=UPI002094D9E7|nr:GNAT family N-acetyltransferase [Aliihoeflea sp. 40Bstr573]MCO6388142.1 GNAT family N-acetyltransferase [Aliihoeflea sp. 40Bstr573]
MAGVTVRDLTRDDQADWKRLWTGYLAFYRTELPEEVYETTWRRLFTPGEFEPRAMLAIADGRAVGLVHFLQHRTCWSTANNLYLQDLYAAPDMRGKGVGRALIEAVYAKADAAGIRNVYWMTEEDNTVDRQLYDRVARRTGFIEYDRG